MNQKLISNYFFFVLIVGIVFTIILMFSSFWQSLLFAGSTVLFLTLIYTVISQQEEIDYLKSIYRKL